MRLLLRAGGQRPRLRPRQRHPRPRGGQGEVAAAGNVDANALSAVGLNPEMMSFQLPAGETVLNADAMAVFEGRRKVKLARAFVEFLLSDAGQKLILLRPGEPGGPRRYPLGRLSVVKALYAEYPPAARSVGAVDPFALGGGGPLRQRPWLFAAGRPSTTCWGPG